MSYTVGPYLVNIDDLKKSVGSKDRVFAIAVLKRRAKEKDETFDESDSDGLVPKDKDEGDEDDWDSWNTMAAVKALVNGDLDNERITGSQYGYALESFCGHLGKRQCVEALEDVHFSGDFDSYWPWLSTASKPLIPFSGYNDDFPIIGYLPLADLPEEIQRTKELDFAGLGSKKVDLAATFQNKAQLQMEWAIFSADYETILVQPDDYPWLDEGYYDSIQQKLETLGFRKVRDAELLHLSHVLPDTRYFCRTLINADRNVGASISQIRIVKPQNADQRSVDIRCVEFSSEFSDGTFLVTANMLGISVLESFDGVTFQNFPLDTPLNELLDYHKVSAQAYCASAKTEPKILATDDDLILAGERQHLLIRADREKKLMEIVAAEVEPDEELIEWLEEIRTDLLALYKKALKAKKDIVAFYY